MNQSIESRTLMSPDPPNDVARRSNVATARSSTLKRINMRLFLDELRRRGPSTRAELSRVTGVAAPTSSAVIVDLVAAGLLEETEDRTSGKGRPGTIFRLATRNVFIAGMTLGPEESVIARADLSGRPLDQDLHRFETPRDYEGLASSIKQSIDRIRASGSSELLGFAVSVPGLVDEGAGRVALSPNLHYLDGHAIGPDLARRLEMDVRCIQEEHALCLAEQSLGQAHGLSDFAVMDITYGMGMGVVSGGRYIAGRDGFAGEIGHVTAEPNGSLCGCGNRGCFETVATDQAFLNRVRERTGRRPTFDELDPEDVKPELEATLGYLALAIAAVVNVFNPDAILVKSRLFDLGPNVLDELRERSSERMLTPSRGVTLLQSKSDRLDGVLAGLLDHVFARVGPRLA